MSEATEVINELTDQIVKLTNSKKVLREELTDTLIENKALNHILSAMQLQLQDAGHEIGELKARVEHYEMLLKKYDVEVMEEVV